MRTTKIAQTFTITEVALTLAVTTKTLIRWEMSGKIKKPKRNWKGWRAYTQKEMDAAFKYRYRLMKP